MNTVFCPECRTDSSYSVKRKQLSNTLNGKNILFSGETAYCDNCNNEVFVPELQDANLEALYEEYRTQNALITPEMISEILTNYNIGKRPFSVLLGWGEQTVSRYINGDIPSKQYSDLLIKIYDNPEFYYSFLEENKSRLSSQLTYNKSLQAVQSILGMHSDNTSNLNMIALYILNKSEDITPLALQKALYYTQGFYFAFYADYLINEDCEAWVHGPVYRNIYHQYSNYRFDKIDKVDSFDGSSFTDMEKGLVDSIIKNICCYSGKILESFTHQELPWILARKGLPVGESSSNIIPRESIGEFFTQIKEQYSMTNPTDIQSYATQLFTRVNNI